MMAAVNVLVWGVSNPSSAIGCLAKVPAVARDGGAKGGEPTGGAVTAWHGQAQPLSVSQCSSARGESRTRTGLPPVDFESSAGPTPSTIKVHNRQNQKDLQALGALASVSGVALDRRW